MEPLVSICIPAYNAARYVGKALDSVLVQTYPHIEVVVVNDGSTDGTRDVLAAYESRGVRVIDQPNAGQCAAANRAFRDSRGDLVKFFDADDLLDPDHVSLQVERLGRRRDAVAMGEWARFYGHDPAEAEFEPLSMYRDADPIDWLASEWMDARPMMQCALWLIPRSILEKSGLWDERLSLINDFEFFARVLVHVGDILYAPGARLRYRSGLEASLSGQTSRKAIESALLSLLAGTEHLLKAEDSARTRQAAANVLPDFSIASCPDYRTCWIAPASELRNWGQQPVAERPPRVPPTPARDRLAAGAPRPAARRAARA